MADSLLALDGSTFRTGAPSVDVISVIVNTSTTAALNWVEPRRDPLVLDLDGNGITTSGINPSAPILFDQDGDGTLTATGWIAAGEAIVVRDLNNNGRIDSGRELFGDNTVLTRGPNAGQRASNGFTALADLDANAAGVADGKFDASDVAFASVKLWKDANQNGISEAAELFTFAALGVQSINLAATATSVPLIGGNTQTFAGTFTREGGAVSAAATAELVGSLLLTNNNFYRQFTDDPAVTTAAQALPQMQGSGLVRDLREAMSLGTPAALTLQAKVNAFAAATTQAAQMALLDAVIVAWGNTATRTGAGAADAFSKFDHNFFINGYGAAGPADLGAVFGAALDAQGFNWRGVSAGNSERGVILGQMLVDAGLVKGYAVDQVNTSSSRQLYTWTVSVAEAFAQSNPARAAEIRALEAFNGQRFLDNFVTNGIVSSQAGNVFVQTRLVRDLAAAQTASLDQAYDALQASVYGALVVQTRLKPYLDSIGLVIDAGGVRFDTTALTALLNTRRASNEAMAFTDLADLSRHASATLTSVGFDARANLSNWMDSLSDSSPTWSALAAQASVQGSNLMGSANDDVLIGSDAADTVNGAAGNDYIYGGAGNDSISAGADNDAVRGGLGNDSITTGAGKDVIDGGDGADSINAGADNDQVLGGLGDDVIEGDAGDDTIDGGAGNDTLTDAAGTNVLKGGTGNDTITGRGSFEGGTGDDLMTATDPGLGDTYTYNLGDGKDTIVEYGYGPGSNNGSGGPGNPYHDVLKFGAGITAAGVSLSRSGNDMVFVISAAEQVSIKDWFAPASPGYRFIEEVQFADGTKWDYAKLQTLVPVTTNTAPTATNLSAAEPYTEDSAKNLVDIVVTDADSANVNVTVTLTLSNVAAGSLNIGTFGAVTSTYAAGTGVWSASGAKADVNTLLAALTFTPAANFNGNFSIATSVSDGVAAAVTGSKAFTGTAVNDAPSGTVTIAGIAAQGQTLTAANTLADVDGLGTLAYQWKAASVVIVGATASTFVLTAAQVGKAITVAASYTDGKGTAESASSAATAAVVVATAAITGTAGADTLTGTSGADQIFGLGGNDTLAGGAGNDTLSGGTGFDSATFSGVSTGYTVTRSAGQVTVSGADGVDVLTSVEQLRFTDKSVFIRAAVADLDADGKSDLLWRNASTGDDVVWKAANVSTPQAVTGAAASWRVAGVADFSGDGKADILWRDTISGANALWLAGDSAQTQAVSSVLDQSWKIAGIGDFDGDTLADILWRNVAGGANAIWKSANSSTGQTVVTVADQYWKVAGIADFDGDGKDDMLWRNFLNGSNVIWKSANNTTGQAVDTLAVAWRVVGLGDFNGDGKDDILWRNGTTGANAIWNGGSAADALAISAVTDLNYAVAAVGDYNGDGRADIAWRNASTASSVIWGAGSSATPITLVGVADVNWTNPAQTGTWVKADGTYF